MINKDSIVTAYDEHLTLVEWLQKVEAALNNAVLTNLGIAKLSDQNNVATYQVTATFADNTTIVSNAFTLPSTDIVTAFRNLTTLVNGFDTRITQNMADIAKNTADIEKKQDTITSSTDLTANSLTVKMENYIYPASIEPSEGEITIPKDNINEPFREIYSFNYGHWRISNGKLSIIVCPVLYNATDTDFSHDFDWLGGSDYIILPQSVADKLIAIAPGGQNIISAGSVETQGIHSDGVAYALDQRKLMYKIMKIGNTIRVQFDLSKYEPLAIAAGTKYAFRLEENFIL